MGVDETAPEPPSESVSPAQLFEKGPRLAVLIEKAKALPPVNTAVVHPVEPISLVGALAAAEAKLINAILIGPRKKIEAAAEEAGVSLEGYELFDAEHSHDAAAIAVSMASSGRADSIMKGALHTDEIMGEVVSSESGLRTERRLSHVFVMDAPAYSKLLFVTDAALNISPKLEEKRDIVQNAIDLARTLGIATPKVAILSAVETVYPKMPSTIDAAALCKMADRGQITGGLLDGPLAFDNAISTEAARAKGISSPVAGDADILIVPDIDAGNMLAKQLDYLAGAVAAGVVLGARVPIVLTSRADGTLARLASCAVANLYTHRRAEIGL